jgi:anion-transporting  ArsA/GET3 family ATPase
VQRLHFVTGKGGVGKTTIAAALAQRMAERGRRVLLVEMAADRGVAALFGTTPLSSEPTRLAARLDAVRAEDRTLVEGYFRRLLRLPFLSRRLFASATFHAVTAAAPGVTEFVLLDQLAQWTAPGWFGQRARYDQVVVDGPASGHALRLLRAPQQLAALVPRGPLSATMRRLVNLLGDHEHTRVVLVAIPDEMAVSEAIEAHNALTKLGLHVTRPVLNRVWPRRFSAADAAAIAALRRRDDHPMLAAAQLEIATRREAERHLGRLRRAFGTPPVPLRECCRDAVDPAVIREMGQRLERGLIDHVG